MLQCLSMVTDEARLLYGNAWALLTGVLRDGWYSPRSPQDRATTSTGNTVTLLAGRAR